MKNQPGLLTKKVEEEEEESQRCAVHGTESQGLSNALRGQNRAGARQDMRLTHQWHLRFQGACATVSYPE